MTGRDLLDAIGYVDESLLERCQQAEQVTEATQCFWLWCRKKYVSIAACVCLLALFILGVAYWRHNFPSVDGTGRREMTATLDTRRLEGTGQLPQTGSQDKTDSSLGDDARKGTSKGQEESDIDNAPDDNCLAKDGSLPDTDLPSGVESRGDGTKADSGNPGSMPSQDNPGSLPSQDNQIAKIDEKGDAAQEYSQGIKIKAVKEIPQWKLPGGTTHPEGANKKPSKTNPLKKILAGKTPIIRGTVRKIQHFHAAGEKIDVYFSVVSLNVKEVYRADGKGNPQEGETCSIYLPYVKGSLQNGSSILGKLAKGSEVIVMPYIADSQTGIRKESEFFAFLDVADYYFKEKTAESQLFLKTKTKALYNEKAYDIPYSGKKVTLDDVGDYIKGLLGK